MSTSTCLLGCNMPWHLLWYLLLVGVCSVTATGKRFIRQNVFDEFECTGSTTWYGSRRSKIDCSEACAKDVGCTSFFYNTVDYTCHGSTLIYTNTNLCGLKTGTVYYAAGKMSVFRYSDRQT